MSEKELLRFGRFTFDMDRYILRRDGMLVHLRPLPTRILAILLDQRGELVDRRALQDAIWGGRHVDVERNLNTAIRQVREALEDGASDGTEFIRTIRGRGYVFVEEVSQVAGVGVSESRSAWPAVAALALVAGLAVMAGARVGNGTTMSNDLLSPGLRLALQEARASTANSDAEELERSRGLFAQVLAQRPDHVSALIGAAEVELRLKHLSEARRFARRALENDPQALGAVLVLANSSVEELDFREAERWHQRAHTVAPDNPRVHVSTAFLNSFVGRHEAAVAAASRAIELDGSSPILRTDLGWIYFRARQFTEAIDQCRLTLAMQPTDIWARRCMINAHLELGQAREAANHAREFLARHAASPPDLPAELSPDSVLGMFWNWRLEHFEGSDDAFGRALLHIRLGDQAAAMDELQRIVPGNGREVAFIPFDPRVDALWTEPDFRPLLERLGFQQELITTRYVSRSTTHES